MVVINSREKWHLKFVCGEIHLKLRLKNVVRLSVCTLAIITGERCILNIVYGLNKQFLIRP